MYVSVCECSDTGVVEDILVVPVNISYDKLLEKTFINHELMVSGGCFV